MTPLRTWWRKTGGLVVACLLAALVIGPTLDAVVCGGEGETAAASMPHGAAQSIVVAHHDQPDPNVDHDEGGICAHGHCHHGLTLGFVIADASVLPGPTSESHALGTTATHASRSPSGLERPPRA
jgi:hypothetical protein